jgi:hypothetical protein
MKKIILKSVSIAVSLGLLVSLSGCAALRKKFTRKKKEVVQKPLYRVRKYDTKPSSALYEKHYIFWVSWHKKLIEELGKNRKSDLRSMREITKNLNDMTILLVDEKALSLKAHIEGLAKVEAIMEQGNMTKTGEVRIRRIIEKEQKAIKREFSPSKMADYIRKEWK